MWVLPQAKRSTEVTSSGPVLCLAYFVTETYLREYWIQYLMTTDVTDYVPHVLDTTNDFTN